MARQDQLEQVIEVLKQDTSPEYAEWGAAVMEVAYANRYVRGKYGLLASPAQYPALYWERNDSSLTLMEFVPGELYSLHDVTMNQEENVGVLMVNDYVFGSENIVMGGVNRVTHDVSGYVRDAVGYARLARSNQKVTKDLTRLTRTPPNVNEVRSFRRAFFSILAPVR